MKCPGCDRQFGHAAAELFEACPVCRVPWPTPETASEPALKPVPILAAMAAPAAVPVWSARAPAWPADPVATVATMEPPPATAADFWPSVEPIRVEASPRATWGLPGVLLLAAAVIVGAFAVANLTHTDRTAPDTAAATAEANATLPVAAPLVPSALAPMPPSTPAPPPPAPVPAPPVPAPAAAIPTLTDDLASALAAELTVATDRGAFTDDTNALAGLTGGTFAWGKGLERPAGRGVNVAVGEDGRLVCLTTAMEQGAEVVTMLVQGDQRETRLGPGPLPYCTATAVRGIPRA